MVGVVKYDVVGYESILQVGYTFILRGRLMCECEVGVMHTCMAQKPTYSVTQQVLCLHQASDLHIRSDR